MSAVAVLEGVEGDGKSHIADDASWVPSEFVHEPPVINVTQPKGSFCQIDARFSVPLSPIEVYDIITDPNNRRVFKNIKVTTVYINGNGKSLARVVRMWCSYPFVLGSNLVKMANIVRFSSKASGNGFEPAAVTVSLEVSLSALP
eukprot:Gb_24414 [translate_table: standard]